ncbi:hypothetical protein [Agrobacterium cavarae]
MLVVDGFRFFVCFQTHVKSGKERVQDETGGIMQPQHRKRVFALCALVLAMAILPPVFFGASREIDSQRGGDPIRNIIFDFQTLITGILAVGAALLTVKQSQEVDQRQQRRHDELFDLQVRPDRLRLARAYHNYDLIRSYGYSLSRLRVPGDLPYLEEQREQITGQSHRLIYICDRMLSNLEAQEMTVVRDLFDGPLHVSINKLVTGVKSLREELSLLIAPTGQEIFSRSGYEPSQPDKMTADIRKIAWSRANSDQLKTEAYLADFMEKFDSLARRYKLA